MDIRSTIATIVRNRKSLEKKYKDAKLEVDSIKNFCEEVLIWVLNRDWNYYVSKLPENNSVNLLLPSIVTSSKNLLEKIGQLTTTDEKAVGHLDIILNRISRGEFNFCFMGAWRQGKSYIQDRLLNLGDCIMPQGATTACTGTVVSVINSQSDDIFDATIYYYSVNQMVDMINSYFEYFHKENDFKIEIDLNQNDLTKLREDFVDACSKIDLNLLATIINPMIKGDSHSSQIFDTLKNFVKYAPIYSPDLGRSSEPVNLQKKKDDGTFEVLEEKMHYLRKKICFFTIANEPCYEVLAVKKVEVRKHFKIGDEEVGPVKFTDTSGIGEKRLGIDDELKRVLLRDTDVAIAVAKVPDDDTTIGHLDTFHDTIASALAGQEPSKWTYYMINRKDNISIERSNEFKDNIATELGNIGLYLPPSHIKVIAPSNKKEIYSFLLDNILTPITQNTKEVDDVLFKRTDDDIDEVRELFNSLRSEVDSIMLSDFNPNEEKRKVIVNEIFSSIRTGLLNLTNELSDKDTFKDEELEKLKDEIDDIQYSPEGYDLLHLFFKSEMEKLENEAKENELEGKLQSFIASKKSEAIKKIGYQVNQKRNFMGDEFSVFSIYRQHLVSGFNERLLKINSGHINKSLNVIKGKIEKVFKEQGGLSSSILIDDESTTFFAAIISKANKEGYSHLSDFFTQLSDTQISYMTSMLDEIKNDILIPSKFSVSLNYTNNSNEIASQFYELLLSIERKIKQGLTEYFEQQSLVDQILAHYFNMVGEIEGNLLKSGDEFNDLYEEFIQLYQKLYSKIKGDGDLAIREKGYNAWVSMRNKLYN